MLMRTDPFRELDRLTQQVLGNSTGTWSRPTAMPMDAYRVGDEFVVAFDLPGVSPDAIELDVERNVLTVKAERRPVSTAEQVEMQVAERPLGVFSRNCSSATPRHLDTEHIDASYVALTLRIPVAKHAKPRKISISNAGSGQKQIHLIPTRGNRPPSPNRVPGGHRHGQPMHHRAQQRDAPRPGQRHRRRLCGP